MPCTQSRDQETIAYRVYYYSLRRKKWLELRGNVNPGTLSRDIERENPRSKRMMRCTIDSGGVHALLVGDGYLVLFEGCVRARGATNNDT